MSGSYALLPHGKQSADGEIVMQRPGAVPIKTQSATALPCSVSTSRFKTFDLANVSISLSVTSTNPRPGASAAGVVAPALSHTSALKGESVAGLSRGKVPMRGIVKTGLIVAAAVATTNRRFEVASDLFTGPFAKRPKHKLVKRKSHHHRLTRISSIDEGQEVVLHPLTT